jgi:flavin-dependent dehydrogenase
MHIRNDGYVGVAPLPGGVVNACVVRELSNSLRSPRFSPDAVVQTVLSSEDALRGKFEGARQISRVTSLGPLAVECRAAGSPGLLLAGDAAGFIDPMTGDGLRFALRGGELAAEAALEEMASGVPAFEALRAARVREFAGKWRVNRLLRSLVASPRALGLAARLASYWSLPFQQLVNIAGDVALARQL